jgi:hypothetical protein
VYLGDPYTEAVGKLKSRSTHKFFRRYVLELLLSVNVYLAFVALGWALAAHQFYYVLGLLLFLLVVTAVGIVYRKRVDAEHTLEEAEIALGADLEIER